MVILIAQIILGIIVFVFIGDIQEASKVIMNKLWEERESPANKQFWITAQSNVSVPNNAILFHLKNWLKNVLFFIYFLIASMLRPNWTK